MNWNWIKREFRYLVKNPVTYIGIVFMVLLVLYMVKPYWEFYENVRDEGEAVSYVMDGDIGSGYILTPMPEMYENALKDIQAYLVSDCDLSEKDAEAEVAKPLENDWDIEETAAYFKEKYAINGIRSKFSEYAFKHATYKEMQEYLKNTFSEKMYSASFSYKYSDALGMGSILFTIIVFSILLVRDMKKDSYSFLHTKPFRGRTFILGKLVAGGGIACISVILLTFIMNLGVLHIGKVYGLPVDYWDMWKNVVLFNIPSVLLTGCLMIFISILFKNIVPTIPALLLYFLYSNIGTTDEVIGYAYKVKPLVLFVRFPDIISEVQMPQGAVMNQCFVIVLTLLLFVGSIWIWERRRD